MSIWQWSKHLPQIETAHQLSLGEGHTPLVHSRRLGITAGIDKLSFKLESCNPSGSYKDRFAAAAISHMQVNRQRICVATSSGNTGAALAAYCAAADIACHIAIVESAPAGKLLQMAAYGAKLYRVRNFGTDPQITERTFDALVRLGTQSNSALQISAFKYSPLGMAGVETISYEIVEECGQVANIFVPAGGGGLALAVARGLQQMVTTGRIKRSPKVHCVQPTGNDTIAGPLRTGKIRARAVQCTSRISGLQVASVIDGDEVITACRETGGTGITVTDEEVFEVQRRLAREEGIFCEPAGAVSVAGALAVAATGEISGNEVSVCLITGSGFKDLASIEKFAGVADCPTIEWQQLDECFGN